MAKSDQLCEEMPYALTQTLYFYAVWWHLIYNFEWDSSLCKMLVLFSLTFDLWSRDEQSCQGKVWCKLTNMDMVFQSLTWNWAVSKLSRKFDFTSLWRHMTSFSENDSWIVKYSWIPSKWGITRYGRQQIRWWSLWRSTSDHTANYEGQGRSLIPTNGLCGPS